MSILAVVIYFLIPDSILPKNYSTALAFGVFAGMFMHNQEPKKEKKYGPVSCLPQVKRKSGVFRDPSVKVKAADFFNGCSN